MSRCLGCFLCDVFSLCSFVRGVSTLIVDGGARRATRCSAGGRAPAGRGSSLFRSRRFGFPALPVLQVFSLSARLCLAERFGVTDRLSFSVGPGAVLGLGAPEPVAGSLHACGAHLVGRHACACWRVKRERGARVEVFAAVGAGAADAAQQHLAPFPPPWRRSGLVH